jgi:hypothetical protein
MYRSLALAASLATLAALPGAAEEQLAQASPSAVPSLPAAPQPTSRLPQGPQGSGTYVVSAAANEHGSFLWAVDEVQHTVVLCEKPEGKDFACTKKPMP